MTLKQIQAGKFTDFIDKATTISKSAKDKAKKELVEHVEEIAKNLKVTAAQVELAFKEPKPQNMLKACGYSVSTLYGAFNTASKIADHGVMSALVHIAGHKTMHKLGHKIKDKAKDADSIIKKYPALKALTGPAIAGLMLYGYTTAPTNSLGDWDLSKVAKAFKGEVSVEDFVQSSEAHALGTHIATGHGMSLSSLAASSVSLGIGLVATAVNNSDHPKLKEIASSIKDRVTKMLPSKKASDQASETTGDKDKDKDSGKKPESKDNPSWWQRKSKDSKDSYLKDHPDSTLTPAYKIAMKILHNAALEEALIKDSSNYSFFKLNRPLNIARRGKDWVFPKDSKIGWRMSSNGKNIRLISPDHGANIVFSLDASIEVMKWLGKNDPKSKR